MSAVLEAPAACRCGCGGPVHSKYLAEPCYQWWRTHGRPGVVPRRDRRDGANPCAIQLRDALKVYLWQHLSARPQSWLTAVELCRVIAARYICDGSGERGHTGRLATVKSCLAELMDAGEVEYREVPRASRVGAGPGRSTAVSKQYRWCA